LLKNRSNVKTPNASDRLEYTSSMSPGTIPSPCHNARLPYSIHENVLKLAVSTDASLHAVRGVPMVSIWLSALCHEWHEIQCHSSFSQSVGGDMRQSKIDLPWVDLSSDVSSESESESRSGWLD